MHETKEEDKAAVVMTTSEVARQLKVSGAAVIFWNNTGKLPAFRTESGRRVFMRSEVEKFQRERSKG